MARITFDILLQIARAHPDLDGAIQGILVGTEREGDRTIRRPSDSNLERAVEELVFALLIPLTANELLVQVLERLLPRHRQLLEQVANYVLEELKTSPDEVHVITVKVESLAAKMFWLDMIRFFRFIHDNML